MSRSTAETGARGPVQRSDAAITRRAFSRFRASRDDAAARPFRAAAVGTEGYPGLDGSIVIKSIGSYYCYTAALHELNSVSRNGADRSVHHQDALWSAREDMPADRWDAERRGRVISRLFAR